MTFKLKLEAAFGVNPTDEVADDPWTDLTERIRNQPTTWNYGLEDGQGSLILDNRDGYLTPENPASPYFPNVVPLIRVRLSAIVGTTTYRVFEAFVEDGPPELRGDTDLVVQWQLVDTSVLLAAAQTSAAYPSDLTGARVNQLLTAVGWPLDKRKIDPGATVMQHYEPSARIVNNALKDCAEAEQGWLFIDPDGDIVFLGRHRLLTGGDPVAEFGPLSANPDAAYVSTTSRFSIDDVVNDWKVEPRDRFLQRAQDFDSRDRFGHRWAWLADIPIRDEAVGLDMAHGLLLETKDPHLLVDTVTLLGHRSPEVLEQCVTRRVGDKVTVQPEYGPARDMWIRGVDHSITIDTWTTVFHLDSVSVYADEWWILDTSPLEIEVGGVPPARIGW